MMPKRLLRILVSLLFLFAILAAGQRALAQANGDDSAGVVVVVRQLTYWQGSFIGFVDAQTYEKWPFTLDQPQQFVVTVVPAVSDLTPLILLLDANGTELARGTGTLTADEPAGDFAVQIQPVSGAGFYQLNLRQAEPPPPTPTPAPPTEPSAVTVVDPPGIDVGGSAIATVSLSNVPSDGYTSAEFTCTYDPGLVAVSNIAATGLFGSDAAVAINGPQNGVFIAAIAGSHGNRAATSGDALTFTLTGTAARQTAVGCTARVSTGDDTLVNIASVAGALTVQGSLPPTEPPPTEPAPTETAAPAPEMSSQALLPTPTPVPPATLTGQVEAGKPVTISLFGPDSSLVDSVSANEDGTFSLTAPAGDYTVVASASGYLKAQGSVMLTDGGASTLSAVSLIAGDLDGNNVIDEFDAMTIGMNYNAASPLAADLNNDGVINVLDLQVLAQHFRAAGALAWQ